MQPSARSPCPRDRLIERIVADTLTQIDQRLKRAVAQVEDVREHVFNLGDRLERHCFRTARWRIRTI